MEEYCEDKGFEKPTKKIAMAIIKKTINIYWCNNCKYS